MFGGSVRARIREEELETARMEKWCRKFCLGLAEDLEGGVIKRKAQQRCLYARCRCSNHGSPPLGVSSHWLLVLTAGRLAIPVSCRPDDPLSWISRRQDFWFRYCGLTERWWLFCDDVPRYSEGVGNRVRKLWQCLRREHEKRRIPQIKKRFFRMWGTEREIFGSDQ